MFRRIAPTQSIALALAALVGALAGDGALGQPAPAAEGSDEHVAKQLANPIAALISVPFRMNADWNLISRTIVPIVDQHVPGLGDGSQSGIGDITQSFFFSPARPTAAGVLWGVAPLVVVPTDVDFISAKNWAVGPTAVALRQQGPWTYGFLTNHVWSVAGSGAQPVSNTFVQPFLSYTTKNAWTFTLQTESTYDWRHSQWTVPVSAQVAKIVKLGPLPVNLGAGVRYYADSPTTGSHGWAGRLVVTFVFPKQ